MADLWRHRARLEAAGARVVVVSFMQDEGLADCWSRQVGAGFEHAIAPGADGAAGPLYGDAFRFRRSVAGVWSAESLGFYAEQRAAGRELESSHGQDVNQLAGDFVIGPDGRVVLPYYSRDNTDRPSVDEIIEAVESSREGAAQAGDARDGTSEEPTAARAPGAREEAPAADADTAPTPEAPSALRPDTGGRAVLAACAVAAVVVVALLALARRR